VCNKNGVSDVPKTQMNGPITNDHVNNCEKCRDSNIIFCEMLMSLCKRSFMLEVVYILKYPYW